MSKAVSPDEAHTLMAEGHTYIDVRSEQEFEAGHPAGAVNVPLSQQGPGGLQPNPDFMTVMEHAFPKDTKLVIGCKSGGRSRRAAALLTSAGYTSIADMVAGFAGSRDAFGRPSPGWSDKGLPVETGAPEGRGYAAMKKR
jgi:rhodanese-related sulfurtransferase